MNAPYNQLSTSDVASMLKVDRSTITSWCRRNLINYINVGEGDTNNRYMFEEREVRYIKKLIDKYGVRKMLLNYNKNWKEDAANYKPEPVKVQRTFDIYDEEDEDGVAPAYYPPSHKPKKETGMDYSVVNTDGRLQSVLPKVEAPNSETKADFKMAATSDFDPEEILDTIIRAQDIKDQIKKLEAELQKCRDIILKAI